MVWGINLSPEEGALVINLGYFFLTGIMLMLALLPALFEMTIIASEAIIQHNYFIGSRDQLDFKVG
jgi:hypothetical protein